MAGTKDQPNDVVFWHFRELPGECVFHGDQFKHVFGRVIIFR
jgi:hypothetical protein